MGHIYLVEQSIAVESGGALYLKLKNEDPTSQKSSSMIQSSNFISNYAASKGGAINYNFLKPQIFQDVQFSENQAKFGKDFAGQKYKIAFKTQNSISIANNALIKQEDIEVMILDRDDQVVEDDSDTQITIQSKFFNASVVGEQIFTVQNGIGIPYISVLGAPGSEITLIVQSLTDYKLLNDSKVVKILPCQLGEVLQNGLCNLCGYGTYVIKKNQESCQRCPSNAICSGASSIEPLSGFWRASNISESIYECFNEKACLQIYILFKGQIGLVEFKIVNRDTLVQYALNVSDGIEMMGNILQKQVKINAKSVGRSWRRVSL
eukprot:403369279